MKFLTLLQYLALLLISTEVMAINLGKVDQPLQDGLYDTRSCNDLYMQATALEQTKFAANSSLFDNRRTKVAGVVSTVFTPALYYLGFNAYQDYQNNLRAENAFAEIEKIRFRMAEKRCFQ